MKQGATFRSDRDLRSQLLPGVAERKKRGDSVGRGLLKFLQLNRFRPGTDWSFPHSQLFSEKRKEKKNEGMEGPPKNSSPPPSFRVSCVPECFHSNSSSLALFTMRAAFFPFFLPADLTFLSTFVCSSGLPFQFGGVVTAFQFRAKAGEEKHQIDFFFPFALSDFSTLSQAPPP